MKTLFILLLCITTSLHAATLLDVYQQALLSDPLFQQAIAKKDMDQESSRISLSDLLPNANMTQSIYAKSGYTLNLNITQTIFDLRKLLNYSQAKILSAQANADLNDAVQQLILRVAKSYFWILLDEENLHFIHNAKIICAKQVRYLNEQYQLGLKSLIDVTNIRAKYTKTIVDEMDAKNQLANDQDKLQAMTGMFYSNLSILKDNIPLVSPQPHNMDKWVEIAKRQNWSIQSARLAANIAKQDIKQQFAGHLPTVDFTGTYSITNSPYSIAQTPLTAVPIQNHSHFNQGIYSLTLSIPLTQGGRVIAKTQQAQYSYQLAYQKLEQQIRETINTTQQSYRDIIASIARIKSDQQIIAAAIRTLRGLQEKFYYGMTTSLDVLNQQQVLLRAQKQYAADRYFYIINLLTLKQVAGMLNIRDVEIIST